MRSWTTTRITATTAQRTTALRSGRSRSTSWGTAFITGMLMGLVPASAHAEGNARHDDADNIEQTIIVGVGGAAELELGDGSLHPGANVMVEWDAIENWLELEVEASVLSADKGVEVPVSLLAKKPFRITRRFEFMIGVGPEIVRVSNPTAKGTYFGGQVALDFMFWLSQHVGLWVEPSYDLIFRAGVSHGVGSTGGVLFGW